MFNGLGRSPDPLTARALCLGVPGFDLCGLAMFGLPPRRLPTTDQPPAFRLLAVALVPAPWLVLAPAAFTQALPRAGPAPSGQTATITFNLMGAHGRLVSQGKSSGRMCPHSPRALSKREPNDCMSV
jgi:hypothetical protein